MNYALVVSVLSPFNLVIVSRLARIWLAFGSDLVRFATGHDGEMLKIEDESTMEGRNTEAKMVMQDRLTPVFVVHIAP